MLFYVFDMWDYKVGYFVYIYCLIFLFVRFYDFYFIFKEIEIKRVILLFRVL